MQKRQFALSKFVALIVLSVCFVSLSVGAVFAYVPRITLSSSLSQTLNDYTLSHDNKNLFSTNNGTTIDSDVGSVYKVQPISDDTIELKCNYGSLAKSSTTANGITDNVISFSVSNSKIGQVTKVVVYGVDITDNSTFCEQSGADANFTVTIKTNATTFVLNGSDEISIWISLYNYTLLSYIQSSGTQYIDTGITTSTTVETSYRTEIQFLEPINSETRCPIGANNGGYFGVSGGYYELGPSNRSSIPYSTTGFDTIYFRQNFAEGKMQLYVNDNPVYERTTAFTKPTPVYLFYIGGATTALPISCKISYFDVYQNDILVRHFIPCKNASDEVGLFDKVTGAFYTNSGTGDFIAGPAV